MKKLSFVCLFLFVSFAFAKGRPTFLYEKNLSEPSCSMEESWISHARKSFNNALQRRSKLNVSVEMQKACQDIPMSHLLNNLCSFNDVSHLHIGLLHGNSFIAAQYMNESFIKECLGIEITCRKLLLERCNALLESKNYLIYEEDCFAFDKKRINYPVNVYFYDAGHSYSDQYNAFKYYDDVFADVFIAVIDDWSYSRVRKGTFDSFELLNYEILFQDFIPSNEKDGNGQYVAVIRKNKKSI